MPKIEIDQWLQEEVERVATRIAAEKFGQETWDVHLKQCYFGVMEFSSSQSSGLKGVHLGTVLKRIIEESEG